MMVQQRFRPILHHLIMLLSYEKRTNLDIVCGISKQIAADRYIYIFIFELCILSHYVLVEETSWWII